jgi:hypothetical protein
VRWLTLCRAKAVEPPTSHPGTGHRPETNVRLCLGHLFSSIVIGPFSMKMTYNL